MSSVAAASPATHWHLPIRPRAVLIGFSATLLAAAVVAVAAAMAIGAANDGRVLPGVRIGGIALGGMDRTAALERLRATLPSLSDGTATVTVGGDQLSVTYAQLGRRYDLEAMADAAVGTGREANPVAMVVARLRDALVGTSAPLQVHGYDQAAMDRLAAQIAHDESRDPVSGAVVVAGDGTLVVEPARQGSLVTASEVAAAVGPALLAPTPDDLRISVPITRLDPAVSTAQAQAAAQLARAMTGEALPLTDGTDSFSLSPAELAGVLRFSAAQGAAYAPHVDPTALGAAVVKLATEVDRPAAEATYKWGATITVVPARTGRALDQAATGVLVGNALAARATGGASSGPIQLPVAVTQPKLTTEAATASVARIVRIGTWTTHYIPGISNGYGANISIPAQVLNGKVIAPGGTLDFWRDIGPVTFARGYRMGGAIINGKSEHTGAIGGGICSTSTTLFNAALRAGLQMGERANHYYYISRYPVGLDATVIQFSPTSQQTMSWTNDTGYPIIIRSYTAYGIVRFDLYSVPTGRTVTLTTPIVTNRTYGHDTYVTTTSLAHGVQLRLEPIYNGFDASVTRYVRDSSGALIHVDQYFSHYHAVNGIVEVGA